MNPVVDPVRPQTSRSTTVKTSIRPRFLFWLLLASLGFLVFLIGVVHFTDFSSGGVRKRFVSGIKVEGGDLTILPESERTLEYVVLGLNQNRKDYFMLPTAEDFDGMNPNQRKILRMLLYWTDLELAHGKIWNLLPERTILYIAVPDADKTVNSEGGEREFFKEYLIKRCGWTPEAVKKRVRFFSTASYILWTQDIGEVLGYDRKGRCVIAVGSREPDYYLQAVQNLVNDYPKNFDLRYLGPNISTEGGDQELVWNAEGGISLMLGRHRVLKYLELSRETEYGENPVSMDLAIEARRAYTNAYYGLPVRIMPKTVLRNPALGDKELFHLDMLVSIVGRHKTPQAFVPTYQGREVIDAINGQPLDPDFRRRLQSEYDRAALALSYQGYEVRRLPFADHPVRSPANFLKYYDRVTGRHVILLGKYPYHLPAGSKTTPQFQVMNALGLLNWWYEIWRSAPTMENFDKLQMAFVNLWSAMDQAAQAPNPFFDAQKAEFEKCGYDVVTVPLYAWGAGGIHCQTLH